MKIKQFILGAVLAGAALAIGWQWGSAVRQTEVVRITDTLMLAQPRPDTVRLTDTVWRRMPLAGPAGGDSATVVVERSQALYSDTAFRAWVSGYEPRLDSIELYRPTLVVERPAARTRSPWGIGLSAGVAITPAGTTPYIGVGISYSFWP